jgi:hypothetical protein
MAKLISGSVNQSRGGGEWASSMAKAMEDAFLAEWPIAMGDQPTPEVNEQMRLLFVAIAKGVVKHLEEQQTAFEVTIGSAGNPAHTHTATMNIITQIDP